MAWLLPELEVGLELELMPLELEEPELEEPELEEPELEEPELEVPELELEVPELEVPEFVEDEADFPEPVDDEPAEVVVLWAEPGSAKVSAPAVTTLAMPTAVVTERTFPRPFSLAAMARRIPSRFALM